jgi:hypothetical protein
MPITRVRSAASASQGRGATRVVSVMNLSYRICGAVEFAAVIDTVIGARVGAAVGSILGTRHAILALQILI